MIPSIISHKFHTVIFIRNRYNSAKSSCIFPLLRHVWLGLSFSIVVPCDRVLITVYMALNQARKGCKGTLAGTKNILIFPSFLIGSSYALAMYAQTNTMLVCVCSPLSFSPTVHNSYCYYGVLCSSKFTYPYSFDGEHKFTIKTQVLSRTQPWRGITITLIDANVPVCIVLPVLIPLPGKCGSVWSNLEFHCHIFF